MVLAHFSVAQLVWRGLVYFTIQRDSFIGNSRNVQHLNLKTFRLNFATTFRFQA